MSVNSVSSTREARNLETNQEVEDVETTSEESAEGGAFDTLLRGLLTTNSANQVSEEELFAALVHERVGQRKGAEVAVKFNELFATEKAALTRGDYVPVEDAAKNALKALRTDGSLTAEEADAIYSEAFGAAQLDSNTSALFDGRGGANDPTMALEELDKALLLSRMMIEKFTDGSEVAEVRSLDEETLSKASAIAGGFTFSGGTAGTLEDIVSPEGSVIDGANGFLFKPVSENEGRLAVLMPEIYKDRVFSVALKNELGEVLEEGNSTGYGELGTREKFAFQKVGGDYPQNLTVEIRLSDGSLKQYLIPDPSQRYD